MGPARTPQMRNERVESATGRRQNPAGTAEGKKKEPLRKLQRPETHRLRGG